MFSVLNVYKPLEYTSHDVVAKLRRIYNLKKIGHLGTLDPLAEGVLPVCLGQATRLIEYFPTGKRYTAEVTLGITTDTLDREGQVLSEQDCPPMTADSIEAVLAPFRGTIEQEVPLYSAVHVGGKKLYKMARQGKPLLNVELPKKTITLHELKLLELLEADTPHPKLVLDVACSSGTYIRSLARDIGAAIGYGGFLSKLVRTEHGKFHIDHAIPLAAIEQAHDPLQYLQHPKQYLEMPIVDLPDEELFKKLANGMKIEPELTTPKLKTNQLYFVEYHTRPVAVAQAIQGKLKPLKVFPL